MNKKNSKIVYLINGLGSGGAEMMLYRLLGKLNREKYRPVVITLLELKGPLKEKIRGIEVPVISVVVKKRYDFLALIRLYKMIKAEKPDILHTQLFAADILGRVIGKILKVPVIVTSIRNSFYGGHLRDFLIRLTEKYADVTTIVSKDAAKRFIGDGVIEREKLKVIYNGLDVSSFHRMPKLEDKLYLRKKLNIPEEGFLWIAVGNLTKQKGYFVLFSALNILRDESFNLVVAGSGPLERIMDEWLKGFGLHDKIVMLGRVDNIPDLMAVADALVLSSMYEGLPGVVLEAMASSLPVVATTVGGTPEIIIDCKTGFLVPPGEPVKLAEAMKIIMKMPEAKRIEMGQAGRLRVEENFSLDSMVLAYEDIYDKCLREKNLIRTE